MARSNRVIVTVVAISVAGLVVTGCAHGNKTPVASPTTTTLAPVTTVPTTTVPVTATTAIGTTTTAAGSEVPPCHNAQISVSGAGGGSGLGHQDQVILFTNQSSSTCVLSGYPGVAGLNAQGDQAVQAQRTLGGYMGGLPPGATIPPNVSLAPGQTASAKVEGTDNPVGSATSCPYYPVLLVTPPNLTSSVPVTVSGLGTNPPGLPGCSPIEVHPVVPGTSGDVS
jgi:Protein of unknown function (DUF4232)